MRLPMVLYATSVPSCDIPPPMLIRKTYLTLQWWARDMLLRDWYSLHPTPSCYAFPPQLAPHPFIGLNKFVADCIHQMRAGKRGTKGFGSSDTEMDKQVGTGAN